jgi:hypothetical protein
MSQLNLRKVAQNQIAIITATGNANAIFFRAVRNDSRRFDSPIDGDFERCESAPTHFNFYKYDYRVRLRTDFSELKAAVAALNEAIDNEQSDETIKALVERVFFAGPSA